MDARIATWTRSVEAASLDPRVWSGLQPWDVANPEDAESEAAPHAPQLLAALQIFAWMFAGALKRAWVHLAAEMQAGKSGVVNALIRIVIQNYAILHISPRRIFVITGMSDDDWRTQTKARLPRDVRPNVHHNGGLKKTQLELRRLGAVPSGLRDILIILDESQVAATASNRVNALIYKTVRELAPPSEWVARNIRFLTVSATDPAKVLSMETSDVPCRSVRLLTTEDYQSVETLQRADRVRALETFGDIGSAKSLAELTRVVSTYDTPLWHILRPRTGKSAEVEAKLRAAFPDARVIPWDSSKRPESAGSDSDSESTETLTDINTLLDTPPATHSFVLLKNKFYAAKTLNDAHVGVLWDRLGGGVGGDNARLQSLLGRACGYGKSSRTVVYTSLETVNRYLDFWRELCHNPDAETETGDHKATVLHRRMPGVVASVTETGAAKVAPARNASNPTADTAANAGAGGGGRVRLNEDNFEVDYREFKTWEEAKAWASGIHPKKQDAEGFYLSSTTGTVGRLSYAEVIAMQGGKKTAGFGNARKLEVGKTCVTHYPCYRDLSTPASLVHIVGKLTRKA